MSNIRQFPLRSAEYMLLSYNKFATASTYQANHEPRCAVDENSKTFWSAKSGRAGEWFLIDLGTLKSVHAVHVGVSSSASCVLYGSSDGKSYDALFELSSEKSMMDDLIVFEGGKRLRFLKIEFISDAPGCFSLNNFRVFGFGNGNVPQKVENPFAFKSSNTQATICWNKVSTAVGYKVRFGSDRGRLQNSKSVYNADSLCFDFPCDSMCYYAVDSFNENGITKGDINVINTVAVNKKIRRVQ